MNVIRCSWVERERSVWLKWKGTKFEAVEVSWLMQGLEIWHRSSESLLRRWQQITATCRQDGAFVATDESACILQCDVKGHIGCEVQSCTPKCFVGFFFFPHRSGTLQSSVSQKKKRNPTTTKTLGNFSMDHVLPLGEESLYWCLWASNTCMRPLHPLKLVRNAKMMAFKF